MKGFLVVFARVTFTFYENCVLSLRFITNINIMFSSRNNKGVKGENARTERGW